MQGKAERILLVEDELEVRTLAREFLEEHGYTVLVASSGGAALELVEREAGPIHLLVTDVVMPYMSGPELASQAMALRPNLKVLYVSGLVGKTVVCEGAVVPGAVVLHKPFTAEDLASKVREVLDGTG
ncbi:MAG TPA: response regulator [Nitrospiraceae bacterium]|nr:response regulator [Nitrospiraceae bacterium]